MPPAAPRADPALPLAPPGAGRVSGKRRRSRRRGSGGRRRRGEVGKEPVPSAGGAGLAQPGPARGHGQAAPLAAAADESPGRGLASRSSRCRRAAEGDGGGPRPDLLLPEMLPPGALPRAGADCSAALRPSSGGQVKGESSALWRIASGLSHASLPAWL
ncbi:translation initiation factor IF-2-like isoform X2 [Lagopus muta]|uniref:translation initiation factor IF-2-like isoform X2 n=1 Tax=Lagopus muta TaxID=64668 RepID=UPI00209E8D09|nr:translation initiation factor IF-2-like isoform X2 [Lagopus muta]